MDSVQLMTEPSEILGSHVLSLAAGDILRESGILLTQDALSSGVISTEGANDEVQAYMSVPVQMLQDSSYVVPVLVKNADGNTFLIDPRHCGLLEDVNDDGQPQYVLAPNVEVNEGDNASGHGIMGLDMDYSYITNVGNVVLGENGGVIDNLDVNQSTILHLGSEVLQGANKLLPEGMCIDMSQLSIVTSNGIVSYVTAHSTEDQLSPTTDIPSDLQDHDADCKENTTKEDNSEHAPKIVIKDSKQVESTPPKTPPPKRRPGRPRKNDPNQEDVMDPPVGKPPYKCDTCGYEAALWGRLKRHKESHRNEKPHRCKICAASYNVEANLTLHMATHNQEQLKCPECQRLFSRVASLRSHLMLHEQEDNLFCTECGDEFALQYQLDSHVMEHQNEWVAKNVEKIYECVKCQRQYTRASALKEHMREHVKVKHSLVRRKHDRSQDRSEFSQKCSTCSKVFQKPSQLLRHMRIHTGEKPYPCDVCGKAFSQKGSLQIHMTKHNGEKPHNCDFCSARFSQKGNLRAHIQRVHSIPQQGTVTFRCAECPCIFRKLGSLNSHMGRAHSQVDSVKELKNDTLSSEQMMQVNVNQIMAQLAALEKATNSGGNLKQSSSSAVESKELPENAASNVLTNAPKKNIRNDTNDILQEAISKSGLEGKQEVETHVGKDKVSSVTGFITLADKSFDNTVRRYTIRQRRVGGVKWHQCSFCCKEFKKPSDLVRHFRIHTREKPFKCPHCFRAFSVKSTLTAHIRTHGGLKHYTCSDCNKKFSSSSSLKVHQRLHNGERPFSCSVCNRTFRTSGHWQSHWLNHCDPSSSLTIASPNKRRRKLKKSELQPGENLPEVMLEEPIVISESGLVQDEAQSEKPSAPRIHTCNQCNASFRKKHYLKLHSRIHSGERPFQCNVCNRSFTSNGILKAHILTHEAVKPYKCDICPGTFSTQGSLKRHLIVHNNIKPFMCPYCHKTFKNRLNCKKHIKNHKIEVARAVAQQANELQEHQFVVTVGDGYSGGDIIAPGFQTFSSDVLSANTTLEGTVDGDKLIHTGGVITHTLLADASGTITLPASLTQESIQEIEDTLNQQLSSSGCRAVLINSPHNKEISMNSLDEQHGPSVIDFASSEAAHAEDVAAAANLGASEDPLDSKLNDEPKDSVITAEPSDLSSTLFGQSFDQQAYDACTFPAITLQGDQLNLSGVEQGATLSANMEAILPQSRGIERRQKGNNTESTESNTETDQIVVAELSLSESEVQNFGGEASGDLDLDIQVVASGGKSNTKRCELCGQTFKRISQLKVHMNSVHAGSAKPHECSHCNRSFTTANGLRLHTRTHTDEKSYACELCDMSFVTIGLLNRHMTVHNDKRPYSCSICSSSFRTPLQLRKHSKSHDTEVKNQRTCKKVPAIIFSEEQTSALATQNVETANTVSEKMLIASAIELSKIKNSEGSKKANQEPVFANQCKFCPKSFRKPSDLVRHVRIHTGERPFCCDYCYRSFTVKSTLNSHRKTHLSDLPKMFVCHVCNLRFSTKGSLKVHMRLHTGSKPFKCPLCNLRFRTSGHRKAHLQSHIQSSNTCRIRKSQQVLSAPEEISNNEVEQILTHQIITEDGSVVEVDAASLLAAGGTLDGTMDGSPLQIQINDSLLQQLQFQNGGNVVIQANGTVEFVANTGSDDEMGNSEPTENSASQGEESQQLIHVDESQPTVITPDMPCLLPTIEELDEGEGQEGDGNELQKQHEVQTTGTDISGMRFEIHTDEHGQIVNIQQTLDGSGVVLTDIGDLNVSDVSKVDIDGSQFQILDNVNDINPGNELDSSGFVTLDISDIIMAPTSKKAKSGKGRGSNALVSSNHVSSIHTCTACGKSFAKPSQLQRHVRIHTGERPFPCSQCWKAFNQKNALKAHMKRHTGERPFQCPHCEHAFTQRGNLKTHIGRAHPYSSEAGLSRRKKMLQIPKNILDDVTFRLDLEGVVGSVVGDLFPQVQNTAETEPQ